MKLDGTITLETKRGERFVLLQDDNGFFGFTSSKGYNSWEGKPYKSLTTALANMQRIVNNINSETL